MADRVDDQVGQGALEQSVIGFERERRGDAPQIETGGLRSAALLGDNLGKQLSGGHALAAGGDDTGIEPEVIQHGFEQGLNRCKGRAHSGGGARVSGIVSTGQTFGKHPGRLNRLLEIVRGRSDEPDFGIALCRNRGQCRFERGFGLFGSEPLVERINNRFAQEPPHGIDDDGEKDQYRRHLGAPIGHPQQAIGNQRAKHRNEGEAQNFGRRRACHGLKQNEQDIDAEREIEVAVAHRRQQHPHAGCHANVAGRHDQPRARNPVLPDPRVVRFADHEFGN